jgi:hypothetical protein
MTLSASSTDPQRQKKLEEAAAALAKARNDKAHYQKKLIEDQGKVNQAEEVARVLEEEFKVRDLVPSNV